MARKHGVDVREATHVVIAGQVKRIASKWGINGQGQLAKPSEGGFGVVTSDGERVDMWTASSYIKDE